MADIIVVGAGGFGREVLDIVEDVNATQDAGWRVRGVVDDRPSEINLDRLAARGIPFLGASSDYLASAEPCHYSIGIGSPSVRQSLAQRFDAAGHQAATLVHSSVTMGSEVTVGDGSVLCAGARLTTNITLGRHVHLNLNVTVGHDTTLGDYVSVNPLASISGDCVIEDGVLIGVSGVVLNALTVGRGSTVGGSACVVRDVPSWATVKGVPAK